METIWACRGMRGSCSGEMHGQRQATSGLLLDEANLILG